MIHVWKGGSRDADGGHRNSGVSQLVETSFHGREPWGGVCSLFFGPEKLTRTTGGVRGDLYTVVRVDRVDRSNQSTTSNAGRGTSRHLVYHVTYYFAIVTRLSFFLQCY